MLALERQTVNQSQTAADYRYQATLHCLATVAAQPDTLPSYALLSNGTTSVTDTGMLSPALAWSGAPEVFASTAIAVTASRSPILNWTVSPVADYTQLEAMRCACQYVLFPEQVSPYCHFFLADPEDPEAALVPGPHFGVLARLNRLPQGWLHRGRRCDVPAEACYKEHCGDTWVWVLPDGLEGLAGFTLILQDIATLLVAPTDGSLPQNLTPPLLVTLWVVENTLPNLRTVMIDIKKVGNEVVYPKSTEITVGQSVIWHNTDPDAKHSATNTVPALFDTDLISSGAFSKPVLFDDTMYTNAGGYTKDGLQKGKVEIDYSDKTVPAIKSKIILKRNYNSLYSPTLVFREDRVVKPQFKHTIEEKIRAQTNLQAAQLVDITWGQWMDWTEPYQGQRTAVKPGATQSIPVITPSRLLPPSSVYNVLFNAAGIRMGGSYPGTISDTEPK